MAKQKQTKSIKERYNEKIKEAKLPGKPGFKTKLAISEMVMNEARAEKLVEELFIQENEQVPVVEDLETFKIEELKISSIRNAKAMSNIKCDIFGMIKNRKVYQVDIDHPIISDYINKKLLVITKEKESMNWKDFVDYGKAIAIKYLEKQRRIHKASAEKNGDKEEVKAIKDMIDEKINRMIQKVKER